MPERVFDTEQEWYHEVCAASLFFFPEKKQDGGFFVFWGLVQTYRLDLIRIKNKLKIKAGKEEKIKKKK